MNSVWFFLQKSGPETIVLVVLAGLLVLTLTGLLLFNALSPFERRAAAAHRLAAGLALGGPVSVILLMVLGAVAGHDRVFGAVSGASAVEKAMIMAQGLSNAMNAWFAGGIALLCLAVLGPLATILIGWRVERVGRPVPPVAPASLGLAAAGGLLGVGVLLRAHGTIVGFSALAAVAADSKATLVAGLIGELPSVMPWSAFGLAALAGAGAGAVAALAKQPNLRVPRPLMVAAVAVLGLGAIAFIATRGRAADVGDNLETALSVGSGSVYLYPERGIRPPTAENTSELARAPVLVADGKWLVLEGKPIARFPVPGGTTTPPTPDLSTFQNLRDQYKVIHPDKHPLQRITLQADQKISRDQLAWILNTCQLAGYLHVQVAVSDVRRFESSVLGPLASTRYRALVVELSDDAAAKPLPEGGTLGEVVKQLDALAVEGRVPIRLPKLEPEPAAEPVPEAP